MKITKNGKSIRGLTPHYDDNKKIIGYTTRSIWGSVTYYDSELNRLDETKRSFLKLRARDR